MFFPPPCCCCWLSLKFWLPPLLFLFLFLLLFLLLSFLASASMSTRSLPMRTRFFFSLRCWASFSSRSFFFSSFDFFFGRVLWFSESKSILPSTFTFGAIFCSVFSLNTFGPSGSCWTGAAGSSSCTASGSGLTAFSTTGASTAAVFDCGSLGSVCSATGVAGC